MERSGLSTLGLRSWNEVDLVHLACEDGTKWTKYPWLAKMERSGLSSFGLRSWDEVDLVPFVCKDGLKLT